MNEPVHLKTPLAEEDVRSLACGQAVLLSGRLYTARDAAHKFLAGGTTAPTLPQHLDFQGVAVYHCGPVMVRGADGAWRVTAAGPTTSAREEPYMATVIERYGLRAVIGKGGMGEATLEACRRCGCVYLSAVGGAAQVLAQAVVAVRNVYFMEEFGSPEAIWELEVRDFPAIVTMDAHGHNLHAEVATASRNKLDALM